MYYLGEIFEHTTIDALVGPSEVVTGSNGRILGIFHEQFLLYVIHNGSAQEDAHRALAASQQM